MKPTVKAAFYPACLLALALSMTACGRTRQAPTPQSLTPIKAGPGETTSAALARQEDAAPNVKLRRDKDGNYTWEITGKNVGRIIEADRTFRRRLVRHAR